MFSMQVFDVPQTNAAEWSAAFHKQSMCLQMMQLPPVLSATSCSFVQVQLQRTGGNENLTQDEKL